MSLSTLLFAMATSAIFLLTLPPTRVSCADLPTLTCEVIDLAKADSTHLLESPASHSEDLPSYKACWVITTSAMTSYPGERHVLKLSPVGEKNPGDGARQCTGSAYLELFDADVPRLESLLATWHQDVSNAFPALTTGSTVYIRFHADGAVSAPTPTPAPAAPAQAVPAAARGMLSVSVSVVVLAGPGPKDGPPVAPCTPLYLSSPNTTYSLTSPGYPHPYPDNFDRCWVLYSGERTTDLNARTYFIELRFTDSEMEGNFYCGYDFLRVRDGYQRCAPLIDDFCGLTRPEVLTACGPYMYLAFRTDASGAYRGWAANFRLVPVATSSCFRMDYDYGAIFAYASVALLLVVLVCVGAGMHVTCWKSYPHEKEMGTLMLLLRRENIALGKGKYVLSSPLVALRRPSSSRMTRPESPSKDLDDSFDVDEALVELGKLQEYLACRKMFTNIGRRPPGTALHAA